MTHPLPSRNVGRFSREDIGDLRANAAWHAVQWARRQGGSRETLMILDGLTRRHGLPYFFLSNVFFFEILNFFVPFDDIYFLCAVNKVG